MVVDVAVFCGLIALTVPIDDQTEKNGWTGPLSLIAAASLLSPLISSIGCWTLPWHELQPAATDCCYV